MPTSDEQRRFWLSALAPAVPLYLALVWHFRFLCDDAFISFRFARHLALGEGLVFNLGQVPPVEGYTNFLWVLVCALYEWLKLDITLAAPLTSAGAGLVLLVLVVRVLARQRDATLGSTLAAALFLASLPPMALWSTGGLETMPLALATFLLWERLHGDPGRPHGLAAGLAALACALLRADGVVLCALLGLAAVGVWYVEGKPNALGRAMLQVLGIVSVGFLAHLIWRYSYYGDWLPNTARVKVGFTPARLLRGANYVLTFLHAAPALACVLLCTLRLHSRQTVALWLPSSLLWLGSLAYAIWVGGDFMPLGRFLFPAVPFAALLFALHAQWLSKSLARASWLRSLLAFGLVALSLCACFDRLPFSKGWLERFHFRLGREWRSEIKRWQDMSRTQERWLLVGRALALHTRLGESIILAGLGAQAYPNELYVYDNYGLVTPEVLGHASVQTQATPGHDLQVPPHFFFPPPHGNFHDKPTYLSAMLVPAAGTYEKGSWPWWAEDLPANFAQHPYSQLVDVQDIPLSEAQGFPPQACLRLLRFRWAMH